MVNGRQMNLLIRRVHLYFGLVLVPWVLLYGVSAVLFNHTNWFTGRELVYAPEQSIEGFQSPSTLAQQAAAELDLQLVPDSARWVGDVSFRGVAGERSVRASLSPEGEGGRARISPVDDVPPSWSEQVQGSLVGDALTQQVSAQASATFSEALGEPVELTLRSYPTLRFQVRDGQQMYTVDVDLEGDVEVVPGDGSASWRSRLLYLHTNHGGSGYYDAKWVWARLVDVMGFAMVTWALTGILMWWKLTRLRRWGGVALAVGFSSIVVMAGALFAALGI